MSGLSETEKLERRKEYLDKTYKFIVENPHFFTDGDIIMDIIDLHCGCKFDGIIPSFHRAAHTNIGIGINKEVLFTTHTIRDFRQTWAELEEN